MTNRKGLMYSKYKIYMPIVYAVLNDFTTGLMIEQTQQCLAS